MFTISVEHFCPSNALVFSVVSPGDHSLAKDLDLLSQNRDEFSTQSFISDVFAKKYLYDQEKLKSIPAKYFVREDFAGYSLDRKSERDVEVVINEAHPLHSLIRKYEEAIAEGKGISSVDDLVNTKEIYKRAQEFFDGAYELFMSGNSLYKKSVSKLQSLLLDPLCLSAVILGRSDIDREDVEFNKLDAPSELKELKEPFPLAPIADDDPRILAISAPEESSSALSVCEEKGKEQGVELWYQRNFPRIKSCIVDEKAPLSKALAKVLIEEIKTRPVAKATKAEFLYICLSSLANFNNPLLRVMAQRVFLYDEEGTGNSGYEESISKIRDVYYPHLLKSCITTLGNLLSNIEGVRLLASQLENGGGDESPKVFISNCSLSDVLSGDEKRKESFFSLMKNLNPSHERQNRKYPIGFCIVPKVEFSSGGSVSSSQEDEEDGLDLLMGLSNNSTKVSHRKVPDGASFLDLKELIGFITREDLGVMVMVSPERTNLMVTREALDADRGGVGSFVDELSRQLPAESSRNLSVCIPDATLIPKLSIQMEEVCYEIPPIPLKGAFLASSILMRNDQYRSIKKRIGRDHHDKVQRQPGVNVGPELKTKSGESFVSAYPQLFELDTMSSIDIDAEAMDFLFDGRFSSDDNHYTFLHQATGKSIAMLSCNTLAVDRDGRPVPVNKVRNESYVKGLRLVNRGDEWEKLFSEKRDNRNSLVWMNDATEFLNKIEK